MAERAGDRIRRPLTELTLTRVRELVREPEAVFWVFIFPILLAAILGLAFRSRPPEALPVAVAVGPHGGLRPAGRVHPADPQAPLLAAADTRAMGGLRPRA